MTPSERWQRRIDAIVDYFLPELVLDRAKARRALAAAERAASARHGQPAGWSPSLRPIEGGTRVADALASLQAPRAARRRTWLGHRWK